MPSKLYGFLSLIFSLINYNCRVRMYTMPLTVDDFNIFGVLTSFLEFARIVYTAIILVKARSTKAFVALLCHFIVTLILSAKHIILYHRVSVNKVGKEIPKRYWNNFAAMLVLDFIRISGEIVLLAVKFMF